MERQLPKNVRQIGNVSDSSKIYVEDYVDTFFNQLCDKAEQEMVGAFLIGETVQDEEQDYIYIYGAIRMKELGMKGKDFVIEEGVWKDACETCKEYFGNAEILGWFIAGGEHSLEVNHNINKLHQKYFSREKSVFVTKNARDKEEKFYIYKYRDMMECNGHYIYYEKNLEMQNYMIATRKRSGLTPSEIIEDRVTKNFRSLVREKAEKTEQKNHSRLVYATSTFLVLVIVVIGVTMLNNYDKMQIVQNTLDKFSENATNEEEKEKEEKKDKEEVIETVGDNVSAETDDKTTQENQDEPQEETPDTQTPDTNTPSTDTPDATAPDATTPDSNQTEANKPATQPEAYIVQKGDTLETISREKYGDISRIDEICKLNGLEDGNLIIIGQKLLLP